MKDNIKVEHLELNKVRRLCMEVDQLAKKYGVEYFFVTEGASSCSINKNEAVRNARKCHEEWERANGYDPEEDWSNLF